LYPPRDFRLVKGRTLVILGILFFVCCQIINLSVVEFRSSDQIDNNIITIPNFPPTKFRAHPTNLTINISSSVPFYNDVHLASQTRLPKSWRLLDLENSKEQVDANSCFELKSYLPCFHNDKVRCLPSLYIIGFEKTGTTILNIWLSHHPNLRTRWRENRFFDHNPEVTSANLDSTWYDYLATQPAIRISQLPYTWTMEKSPAYAQNPFVPRVLSSLVPSAKFLLVTRDPTQRAYSMFQMYTNHYADVIDGIRGRPRSYFVKNLVSNAIRYIGDNFRDLHPLNKKTNRLRPGVAGTLVPLALAPPSCVSNITLKEKEWMYLNHPPDPEDFDRYIRYVISKHNKSNQIMNISPSNTTKKSHPPQSSTSTPSYKYTRKMSDRGSRILTGGLYGPYIEQWLQYFQPTSLIVIPSEDFFSPNEVVLSMTNLQEVLGLPKMDYQSLLKKDSQTGRFEIPRSLGTILNRQFNNVKDKYASSSSSSSHILPQTKKLLDDFYCESNRQLKRLTNSNRHSLTKLDDYSCYNS